MELPWPVSVVLAALSYLLALPFSCFLASGQSQIAKPLSKTPLMVWPYFSELCVFAFLMSYITGLKEKITLYGQKHDQRQDLFCTLLRELTTAKISVKDLNVSNLERE